MTTLELRASLKLHERRVRAISKRLAKAKAKKDHALVKARRAHLREEQALVARRKRQLKHAATPASSVKRGTLWLPGATRTSGRDCGPHVGGGAKITWHTTEGSSVAGALGAFRTTGSWPTLTFNPETGELHQHMPLNRAARALEHPAGTVETNRANTVQVELVGRAADTPHWSDRAYQRIAQLARQLEAATGCPRRVVSGVKFAVPATRLSSSGWYYGSGHCGHEHVPSNHHWDPGAFKIALVLEP